MTKEDIDFADNKIRIDHQLQRKRDMEYVIETPKTEKGMRYVPMSNEVRECFKRILENRKKPKIEPVITPHVARHTFCSNMAKSGVNPKKLQYIMGHSDIGVTLNTYTHLQFEDFGEEMEKVCTG